MDVRILQWFLNCSYRVVSARDLSFAIHVKTHAYAILVHKRNSNVIDVVMVGLRNLDHVLKQLY